MALVSYIASDSESLSDEETEDSYVGSVVLVAAEDVDQSDSNANCTQLFTALPQPASSNRLVDVDEEVEDEFLRKKEVPTEKPQKKPVRIVAPSLNDFDSDEDDQPKSKKSKITSNCGLFSILPPPKQTLITPKTFIPNSVKKKVKQTSKNAIKPTQIEKNQIKKLKIVQNTDSDDDSSVEEFDLNAWQQVCARKTKSVVQHDCYPEENVEDEINSAPEAAEPYNGLDNEAFKKLVGSSKMRRENIKLIDVNEAEVLTGEEILRAKALTDPEIEPPKVNVETITAMSKKKHHITYLAQQAKANEQELKNRWAANRQSRKQRQAKYGF